MRGHIKNLRWWSHRRWRGLVRLSHVGQHGSRVDCTSAPPIMSEKWEGGQWEQCAWRVSIMPCQSWLQSCQEELFPHRTTPPLSHEPFFSWYNKYWMKLEEQYVVLGKKRQDFPNNVCSHDRKKLTLIGATQFDTVADPATFSSFETVENSLFYSVME